MVSSKRKRNKASPKFENQTYKNKGGIASLQKKEIVNILVEKYKHPNADKLLKKTKKVLVERLQQVQQNIGENAYIPIPEMHIEDLFINL